MSKIANPILAVGHDLVLVCGSFRPNGSSNPTVIIQTQEWFTLVRTNVGIYTITFMEGYPSLIGKWADIAMSTPTDLKPQWGAYTAPDPSTATRASIVLNILALAVPTDIAANAANVVSFGFLFRKTSY